MSHQKILTFDIEAAPMVVDSWGLFDQTHGLNQVRQHSSILSISWKWMHEKRVHYADCFQQDTDKGLSELAWGLLDDADVVIGQNVVRYDVRKLNARFMQHGFAPYSPVRVIDTMRMAKRSAMFDSNKLEHLAAVLTAGRKSLHGAFPGHSLWTEFMKGNPKARVAMRKYNAQDVRATEDLYRALAPWDRQHPVMATDSGCPRCGGRLHRTAKEYTTSAGRKYPLLQCGSCHGWSRLSRAAKGSTPIKPVLAA